MHVAIYIKIVQRIPVVPLHSSKIRVSDKNDETFTACLAAKKKLEKTANFKCPPRSDPKIRDYERRRRKYKNERKPSVRTLTREKPR